MKKNPPSREDALPRLGIHLQPISHGRGNPNALVTLVEYGDYYSLEARRSAEITGEAERWLRDLLYFVFRHFPSRDLSAVRIVEAAARQGFFWEAHQQLLQTPNLPIEKFIANFQAVLDPARLIRDANDSALQREIQKSIRFAQQHGVAHAPTYLINGVLYEGRRTGGALIEALERAGLEMERKACP